MAPIDQGDGVEESDALVAYEVFAKVYNDFNHLNDYEMWIGRALLPELEKHGLKHGRALDVGCGSGRAFKPLRRRGWKVFGCDISPAMLRLAEAERDQDVRLACADMRALPTFGEFELILSLNDPINYLLGEKDLQRAFSGIRSNLAPDGLVVFDSSSRMTFETLFSDAVRTIEYRNRRWTWRGEGAIEGASPVFGYSIEGDEIGVIRLRERFRSGKEVSRAMTAAGLQCIAALGMEEVGGEIVLTPQPDEDRQYKIVYIGSRAA